MVVITNILVSARRGTGSSFEILYGTVTFKPTMAHSRGTSIVLPATTTFDLVDGQVVATNVQPTPPPVDGTIEWAYEVVFRDRYGKEFSFLVGVPDSTTQVNFTELPRYYESKPPLFGEGPKGDPGEAATIAVGSVTSGTTPSVTNVGTSENAVFNFVLAKGDKGDKGDPGVDGVDGVGVPTPVPTDSSVLVGSAGNTEWVSVSSQADPLTYPVRGNSGEIRVGDPLIDADAANKKYVDNTRIDPREYMVKRFSELGWSNMYFTDKSVVSDHIGSGADINVSNYQQFANTFDSLDGFNGKGIIPAGVASGVNQLLIVAEYVTSGTRQTLFSSGPNGMAISVEPNGDLRISHPTAKIGARIVPGKYVFEVVFDNFFFRVRINGRFAYETRGFSAPTTENSWSLGMAYAGDLLWSGTLGLVLMGTGIGNKNLNKTRKHLMKSLVLDEIGHLVIDPHLRVYVKDANDREVMRQGDVNIRPAHSMASITKSINALVIRQLFTDAEMDNDVTIKEEDIFTGASNFDKFQVGDIFTIRELLSLSLSPSNDSAPRTLARVGGERISGSLPPRAKFVRKMQDFADSLTPRAGVVMNVRASSMLTSSHGVQIAKLLAADPVLTECSSRPIGYRVTPRGPNSREVFCTQGFYGLDIDYRVFHSGKSGSVGTTWKHYMTNFTVDGMLYSSAIFSSHESFLNASNTSVFVGAVIDDIRCENFTITEGSHTLIGAEYETSGKRDITERFTGTTRNAGYSDSGIYIERTGRRVTLDFVDVNLPANTNIVGAVPSGFTPGLRVRGLISDSSDRTGIITLLLTTGQFYAPAADGTRVSGSMSWDVSWVKLSPSAIPGYPPDYELGNDT